MWLALATLLATVSPAHAGACDVKALNKALAEAGPNQAGLAFAELAACDAAAAKAAAPEAFKKILAGDSGDAAVVTAIGVGAGATVRDWANAQMPDDRSRTISKLGEKCDQKGVPEFFTETATALGEKFWSERWYRGIRDCRAPQVQELLKQRMADPGADRMLLFGVIEVFGRNLGRDAIPALKQALIEQKDPEIAAYFVNAFADAAGVGSVAGMNVEAAKEAVAAINALAPTLPAKAVDQARTTLLNLGAEADSDRLAVIRYKDAMQSSGGLLYGVVTTEVATCKKGDTRVVIHTAQVNEGGKTWPDQVNDRLADPVKTAMKLDLASSGACKGTGTHENATPPGPFKDGAAYQKWVDDTILEIQKKYPDLKIKVMPEEPLSL